MVFQLDAFHSAAFQTELSKYAHAQAQAYILPLVHAQANALIDSPIKVYSGQAQAYIQLRGVAQATALIVTTHITFVQNKVARVQDAGAKAVTLDSAPIRGNLLVAVLVNRGSASATPPVGMGWILIDTAFAAASSSSPVNMWYRFAGVGESAYQGDWGVGAHTILSVSEYSGVARYDASVKLSVQTASATPTITGLTASSRNILLVAAFSVQIADFEHVGFTPGTGYNELMDNKVGTGTESPQGVAEYRIVNSLSPHSASVSTSLARDWGSVFAVFVAAEYAHGQAMAYIVEGDTNQFAQAQASILQTYNNFAQAQGTVLQTYQGYAQAQSDIKQTYQGYAQAQGWIENTYLGFAQAQGTVLQVYQGYAQAQGTILTTYFAHSQAQAEVDTGAVETYAHAQAQGWIEQTYFGHAQAQGTVLTTYFGHAQAQAEVASDATSVHAQAQGWVNRFIIVDHFEDATIAHDLTGLSGYIYQDMSSYDNEAIDPDPVYSGSNPDDGSWSDSYYDSDPSDTPVGWMKFTLTASKTVVFNTYQFNNFDHDTVMGIYTGDSESGDWTVVVGDDDTGGFYESEVSAFLPAGTYYLQVGLYGYAVPRTVRVYYNATTGPQAYAQARAFIHRTIVFAQARAKITRQLSVYNNLVISDGAQAYYRLDEALELRDFGPSDPLYDTAEDSVGSYDLTREYPYIGPVGGYSGIPGSYSPAIRARGSGSTFNFLYRYNQSSPITSASNWGIEVWVNLISTAQGTIILVGNTSRTDSGTIGIHHALFGGTTPTFYASIGTGGGVAVTLADSTGITITTGVWYHLVLTRGSSGNVKFYINTALGNSYGAGTTALVANPPQDTVFISPDDLGEAIDGYIDEVALYTQETDRLKVIDHYTYGTANYFVRSAQAMAFITKSRGHAQARAQIKQTYRGHAQARARIKQTYRGFAQAQASIVYKRWGHAQAQARIIYRGYALAQAQASIFPFMGWSQASATIAASGKKHAQARAKIITPTLFVVAQTQAFVTGQYVRHAQAQAFITSALHLTHAQAQTRIVARDNRRYAQSQAAIKVLSGQYSNAQGYITNARSRAAQAQAYIAPDRFKYAQVQALITPKPGGYAQAQAYIGREGYLVQYNNHVLPGYLQSESFTDTMRTLSHDVPFGDGSLSEYISLEDKLIALDMKIVGDTYLDIKDDVYRAGTMLRSKRSEYGKLYLQRTDRYFLVRPKTIKMDAAARDRTVNYEIEFAARPWIFTDEIITVSGTGSIDTGTRTFAEGTWTPATVRITGTNVTVSGYTEYGHFTGYISVSGAVNDLVVNTEQYTATIGGVNQNNVMRNLDYILFVGPGKTYFDVDGATAIEISWQNRW